MTTFTDNETKLLCAMVGFLMNMFPLERLAQSYGTSDEDMRELQLKAIHYIEEDPRKANREIYTVIAHIIEDRGEGLLDDSGVDFRVCQEIAEEIMNEIKVRWALVPMESKDLLVYAKQVLDHPDVKAMPFALASTGPAKRLAELIKECF